MSKCICGQPAHEKYGAYYVTDGEHQLCPGKPAPPSMVDEATTNSVVTLKNGRRAQLTEAGWEVFPWTSDREELIFDSLREVTVWGSTHDQLGNLLTSAPPSMVDEARAFAVADLNISIDKWTVFDAETCAFELMAAFARQQVNAAIEEFADRMIEGMEGFVSDAWVRSVAEEMRK